MDPSAICAYNRLSQKHCLHLRYAPALTPMGADKAVKGLVKSIYLLSRHKVVGNVNWGVFFESYPIFNCRDNIPQFLFFLRRKVVYMCFNNKRYPVCVLKFLPECF